jgi:hypothetical protein
VIPQAPRVVEAARKVPVTAREFPLDPQGARNGEGSRSCRSCPRRWRRGRSRSGTRKRVTRSRSTISSPRSRPTRRRWSTAPSTRGRCSRSWRPRGAWCGSASRWRSSARPGRTCRRLAGAGARGGGAREPRGRAPAAANPPRGAVSPEPRAARRPGARARPRKGPSPAASMGPTGRVKASPYVRKMAREQGFDLAGVAGSGPGGRIVARDLEGAKQAAPGSARPSALGRRGGAPAAVPGTLAEPEVRPLSMMRKAIARRLTESKQTGPAFLPDDRRRRGSAARAARADQRRPRVAGRGRAEGELQRPRREGVRDRARSACRSATRSSAPTRSSSTGASTSRWR